MAVKNALSRLIIGLSCLLLAFILSFWDEGMRSWKAYWHPPEEVEEEITGEEEVEPQGPVDETLEIKRGDTLSTVLTRAEIPQEQATAVIDVLKQQFNPRDLRPEQEIYITYIPLKDSTNKKDLLSVLIKLDIDLEVIAEKDELGFFKARTLKKELVHEERETTGQIEESLYMDALKQGANPKVLHQMIQAFSYDVDFQRAFQKGDQYSLLFDYYKEPESLEERPGDLLYGALVLQGKTLRIYRFTPKDGVSQYFNEKGESVKKGLLRTPIDGAKISSGYGNRLHPILGYTKMHKGVDFAAPRGTPIMAAGNGKVVKIGPWGAYGKYILLRHNAQYSTAYAHLSRFAPGLKTGSPVRQGQVIGYVGRTGRATGDHLHYELLANGKQINPNSIKLMPSGRLKGADLKKFMAVKAVIDKKIGGRNKAGSMLTKSSLPQKSLRAGKE